MATTIRAIDILKRRAISDVWIEGIGVAFIIFVIYFVTGKSENPYNQYVLLADAFLDGRLYILNAPPWLELAQYGAKGFVIDPPAPTLFLLPVVAIKGADFNQVVVSMIVGAAAMGLFWVAGHQLGWGKRFTAAMTVLLTLGTNFWWVSTDGSLWMFAHVSAVFFLMAALVEGTGQKRPWLVGIFIGLAGLSRLPTFLCFPLFAFLVSGWEWDRKSLIRLGLFFLPIVAFGLADLLYNYGRFDTWRDEGYYHPQYDNEPWFSEGRLDITYIPRHINAIFFEGPVLQDDYPYFRPSNVGLSLFFTTPALLYAFHTELKPLTIAAIAALVLTAIPLITHGTTGWAQFGYRFSLDVLPQLAILVASGMRCRLTPLAIAVIVLSCGVNLWGTLSFHKLDWAV